MIRLGNAVTNSTIEVPEVGENIPTEYFEKCVEKIGVSKHHAIVALIYKDKLSLLYQTYKGNKNNSLFSSVTPILVKADMKALDEVCPGIKIGNPIIAGGSELSLGHHVTSKENVLEIENVLKHISSDKALVKEVNIGGIWAKSICKFVEFKIIPYNSIHGYYSVNSKE